MTNRLLQPFGPVFRSASGTDLISPLNLVLVGTTSSKKLKDPSFQIGSE